MVGGEAGELVSFFQRLELEEIVCCAFMHSKLLLSPNDAEFVAVTETESIYIYINVLSLDLEGR